LWLDRGGALQVGPRSAGAMPGPVCYDLGGTDPTITDANVILGYVNPRALAAGEVRLNPELAREAIHERIAPPLRLNAAQAAHGGDVIAAATMIRAIKAVSSERGRDPRSYTLCAFGGNGPVFASTLARALGMKHVAIPPAPGLFSSFGLLYSQIEHHLTRAYPARLDDADPSDLTARFAQIEAEAIQQLGGEGY